MQPVSIELSLRSVCPPPRRRKMNPHVVEWLNLAFRWFHIIAGMAWIGASFYFNFLENMLDRNEVDAAISARDQHSLEETAKIVNEYEARLDINSTHFDASAALAAGRIIAPDTAVPHLENVSKFKVQMMHNSKPGGALLDYTLIDKAKSILAQIRPAHSFDSMATYAAGMNTVKKEGQGGGRGVRKAAAGARSVQPQSPLAMLEHLMKNKVRAHIVVRRRGGIKGILLGYVHAFDRHMNLLMSDVDEVFAPNWKEVRVQATPDSFLPALPATVLIHEPSPCIRLTPSPLVTYTTTLTSTTDATLHPAPLLSGVFPADHQAAAEGEQQG